LLESNGLVWLFFFKGDVNTYYGYIAFFFLRDNR